MFEVTATGKNEAYGKKDERVNVPDHILTTALKAGWIEYEGIKHVGFTKDCSVHSLKYDEQLIPIRRINMQNTIKLQIKAIDRLTKEAKRIKDVNKQLIKLLNKPRRR